jgi:hypothetical protein
MMDNKSSRKQLPRTGVLWPAALAGICLVAAALFVMAGQAGALDLDSRGGPPIVGGGYIGSKACSECHPRQYERFMTYSLKSKAYQAVEKMAKGLTDQERESCFACHTTGYQRPTGFVNIDKTPHLADVGCEACHGPGTLHTQTMDMAHIVKTVTIDVCERCHGEDLVRSFRYRRVIYAGAH